MPPWRPSAATAEATAVVAGYHMCLATHQAQIAYADFLAEGYPISSGIVEDGHKQVTERQLKGGRHALGREAIHGLLAL